jgi:hypothetical protein
MSSIVNKIKEAINSDKHSSHEEGTSGPHNTRVANAADPRVDSDRDGSHTTGTGNTGTYGSSGNYTHSTGGPAPNTAGPHKTDMLNKADPRVDADRDGRGLGGNVQGTTGFTGTSSHNAGTGFTSGTHGTHAEGQTGPHNSKVANTLDPRVDSDRDGNRTVGGNTYGSAGNTTGFAGTHSEGTHGPHSSQLANAADPRVDSDRDGSRTAGTNFGTGHGQTAGTHTTAGRIGAAVGGTHGTGPAPNTAGPHKSDMLNKVDPRVDSDLDNSKTMGNNQTFSQS